MIWTATPFRVELELVTVAMRHSILRFVRGPLRMKSKLDWRLVAAALFLFPAGKLEKGDGI